MDGEQYLATMKKKAKASDRIFMKAIGIWFIIIGAPGIVAYLAWFPYNLIETVWGDIYFPALFLSAVLAVPPIDRWLTHAASSSD